MHRLLEPPHRPDWISIELTPVFVIMNKPPRLAPLDNLLQKSRGLGPIAGASIGVGFWFGGDRPLDGYVVRVLFANYGYRYNAERVNDDPTLPDIGGGIIDTVPYTERKIAVMFGTHSIIGDVFTIAGGIGIGYELNQPRRCFPEDQTIEGHPPCWDASSNCDDDALLIGLDHADRYQNLPVFDLNGINGPIFPFELMGRISFGVTIDL